MIKITIEELIKLEPGTLICKADEKREPLPGMWIWRGAMPQNPYFGYATPLFATDSPPKIPGQFDKKTFSILPQRFYYCEGGMEYRGDEWFYKFDTEEYSALIEILSERDFHKKHILLTQRGESEGQEVIKPPKIYGSIDSGYCPDCGNSKPECKC